MGYVTRKFGKVPLEERQSSTRCILGYPRVPELARRTRQLQVRVLKDHTFTYDHPNGMFINEQRNAKLISGHDSSGEMFEKTGIDPMDRNPSLVRKKGIG